MPTGPCIGAYFAFQAPQAGVVHPLTNRSWSQLETLVAELLGVGIHYIHLHNPFGMHHVERTLHNGHNSTMHIDQFEVAGRFPELAWLADRAAFSTAIHNLKTTGPLPSFPLNPTTEFSAYVGSPAAVPSSLRRSQGWDPPITPEGRYIGNKLWAQAFFSPFSYFPWTSANEHKKRWFSLLNYYIRPFLESGMEAIGFDKTAPLGYDPDVEHPYVREWLINLADHCNVLLEAWPRLDKRPYSPRYNWILTELNYQKRRLNLFDDLVPFEQARPHLAENPHPTPSNEMPSPIRRIVFGTDEELKEINDVLRGSEPFESTPDMIANILNNGDIALVARNYILNNAEELRALPHGLPTPV